MTNTNALYAQNILTSLQSKNTQTMEQLSTGQQINSAANNPAALAISQRLQEQSTGNSQAIKNIQEGLSMIQTADGGLSNIQAILQKMQTLAIEAQNTTLSSSDVNSLQQEYNSLVTSLTQISDNSTFNGISLLNHSAGLGLNGSSNSFISIPNSSTLNSIKNQISIELKINPSSFTATSTNLLTKYPFSYGGPFGYGPYWLSLYNNGGLVFEANTNGTYPPSRAIEKIFLPFNQTSDVLFTYNSKTQQYQAFLNGALVQSGVGGPPVGSINTSSGNLVFGAGGISNTKGIFSTVRLYNQVLTPTQAYNNYQGNTTQNGLVGNWSFNENQGTSALDGSGNGNSGTIQNGIWVNYSVNLQIGNRSSDTYSLILPSVNANDLGLSGLSITGPKTLSFLSNALNVVVGQRELLGSQQVSLQAQMTNLQSSIVTTKSANSQIKDANMTQQMSELTKNQVQQQMSLSMLNTANQNPKILFKLLQ